jgi:Na+/H+-translocating membrane pyrophosphatase
MASCRDCLFFLSSVQLFFLGLIAGGAMIYWFTGASMQAVTTGAYRAVEFIKRNIRLNKLAISTATEIHKLESKSAKWIASDAGLDVLLGELAFAAQVSGRLTVAVTGESGPQGVAQVTLAAALVRRAVASTADGRVAEDLEFVNAVRQDRLGGYQSEWINTDGDSHFQRPFHLNTFL